jgi:hypothetical protein
MSMSRPAIAGTALLLLLVMSTACAPPLVSPQPEHPAPSTELGRPSPGDQVEVSVWVSPGTTLSLTILHTADTWGYVLPCG